MIEDSTIHRTTAIGLDQGICERGSGVDLGVNEHAERANNAEIRQSSKSCQHLAVIMDGNRRWAKARGLASVEGHKAGLVALKKLVRLCPRYGIKHLTAYAFSTENWRRSQVERDFIFTLLEEAAVKDLQDLVENGVRVDFWGNFEKFQGTKLMATIEALTEQTRNNNLVHLHIALSYGSYQEFYDAYTKMRTMTEPMDFSELLYSRGVPDPELMIRTGGEMRLSNYLLYQCSNSYMKFLDDFWPDFGEAQLAAALQDYESSRNGLLRREAPRNDKMSSRAAEGGVAIHNGAAQ